MRHTIGHSISIKKFVLWFAIGGGVGIPLFFLVAWQIISRTLHGTGTIVELMVWVEAFRIMFWPSSMYLVVSAPGDGAGELKYLLLLILVNIGVYALMGLAVALALRSRAAQIALGLVLVAAMYGLNAYWSEHLASFIVAAILLVLLLLVFFRKFGVSPPRAAN
jgi:hypothetical protein